MVLKQGSRNRFHHQRSISCESDGFTISLKGCIMLIFHHLFLIAINATLQRKWSYPPPPIWKQPTGSEDWSKFPSGWLIKPIPFISAPTSQERLARWHLELGNSCVTSVMWHQDFLGRTVKSEHNAVKSTWELRGNEAPRCFLGRKMIGGNLTVCLCL